ncbi:MAG: hypothetical protein KF686_16080 [Ramlibacter sp.]|nr:hypothetical protein [Ramlibacter sp.]
MSKILIAAVATAIIDGGERITVPVGGELRGLSAHDQRELLASGAAIDPSDEAAFAAAQEAAQMAGLKAFQAARKAVRDEQVSIAPPAPPAEPPAAPTPPAPPAEPPAAPTPPAPPAEPPAATPAAAKTAANHKSTSPATHKR